MAGYGTGLVNDKTVLVIAGPTGVGKSRLAVKVAQHTGAEIISADSRQLYRGLDIGTATPSLEDRGGVPHHLIDVLDPTERVNAGWFADQARAAAEAVWARGNPVVVVGGSTLYVHALIEGLAPLPSLPAEMERELAEQARSPEGRSALFEELKSRDTIAAATLDATKTQRLVRLLGSARTLKSRVSNVWSNNGTIDFKSQLLVLERPRVELYSRIDARVLSMISGGLVSEVQNVLKRWPESLPILQGTIGYKELLPVIDGTAHLGDAVALIQRNSRRYAKRQLTWYRRYPQAQWVNAATATVETVQEQADGWPVA